MEWGFAGIGMVLLLGSGIWLLVRFASREYFRQREAHLKRVMKMDLTEENGK